MLLARMQKISSISRRRWLGMYPDKLSISQSKFSLSINFKCNEWFTHRHICRTPQVYIKDEWKNFPSNSSSGKNLRESRSKMRNKARWSLWKKRCWRETHICQHFKKIDNLDDKFLPNGEIIIAHVNQIPNTYTLMRRISMCRIANLPLRHASWIITAHCAARHTEMCEAFNNI